jgi:hypothetical protein
MVLGNHLNERQFAVLGIPLILLAEIQARSLSWGMAIGR